MQSLPDKHYVRPTANLAAKEKCWRTSLASFLCQLFNWLLEHGAVPSSFKTAYITPLLKKNGWCQVLQANLQSVSHFQAAWMDRCEAGCEVSQIQWPAIGSSVSIQSPPLAVLKVLCDILLVLDSGNWRCSLCSTCRWFSIASTTIHFYSDCKVLQPWRGCYQLVHFLPDHIGTITCCIWSTSRVNHRTNPVPTVCCRRAVTGQAWSASSHPHVYTDDTHSDISVLSTYQQWYFQ